MADHYRKNSKVQMVSSESVQDSLADAKIDLEQAAVLTSDMDGVRRAMATMNEDYQNAIVWRYLEDMPVREVAQLLDRTEEATRVLLHRAMKDLRTKLS